jgi:hypothetical protein
MNHAFWLKMKLRFYLCERQSRYVTSKAGLGEMLRYVESDFKIREVGFPVYFRNRFLFTEETLVRPQRSPVELQASF